jgi:NADH-quinone oxidoreductase subunit A
VKELPIHMSALWPTAVYAAVVVLNVAGMLFLSFLLGQRHRERSTGQPYESGMAPTGTARMRFDIKFYLVAMLFVIFDLEAIFIFAWAVALRELGWAGYVELLVFVGVLFAALVYLWREGALDWGTRMQGQGARVKGQGFHEKR